VNYVPRNDTAEAYVWRNRDRREKESKGRTRKEIKKKEMFLCFLERSRDRTRKKEQIFILCLANKTLGA
jgi:hypothetical protein